MFGRFGKLITSAVSNLTVGEYKILDTPIVKNTTLYGLGEFPHETNFPDYDNKTTEVNCNLCQADVDPLIIHVSLDAGNNFVDSMVDTGAGVSLLNEGVLPHLSPVELKPSIEVPVVFDSGFTTEPIKFFLVPIEYMTHSVILGAVALKDNKLLPDMTYRELLHRTQDNLTSVGKDISLTIPFYNCIIPETTIIPPNTCKMLAIEIPDLKQYKQKHHLVEFLGENHSGLQFIPGVLDVSLNENLVAVLNSSNKEQCVRKQTLIGKITNVRSKDLEIDINQETPEITFTDPKDYWNAEKVKVEFGIGTLSVSTDQQDKLISVLLKYPHVLSTGENDVGLAQNITQ